MCQEAAEEAVVEFLNRFPETASALKFPISVELDDRTILGPQGHHDWRDGELVAQVGPDWVILLTPSVALMEMKALPHIPDGALAAVKEALGETYIDTLHRKMHFERVHQFVLTSLLLQLRPHGVEELR